MYMERIPAALFRKRSPKTWTEPVQVTINDIVVGTWYPLGTIHDLTTDVAVPPITIGNFGVPRPAPKPSKKR